MNKEILEYYLEAHEEKFGTRPEIKKPIAEQIDILNKALKDGYPVEFEEDKNIEVKHIVDEFRDAIINSEGKDFSERNIEIINARKKVLYQLQRLIK
jgi:hypothetical protein